MKEPTLMRSPGPHPTPEEIYRARHRPGGEESERILAHAAGCALCTEEVERQEAFDAPEPMPAPALEAAWERFGRSPAARPSSRWKPAYALAATLAICAVGLGFWSLRERPQETAIERGSAEAAQDWQPSGLLDAPPATFVFPAPEDEPRRVRVFDESPAYTWTSGPVAGGQIDFPEAERNRLRPGVEYFWTVLGGQGEEEQGAAPSFRVRNPAAR